MNNYPVVQTTSFAAITATDNCNATAKPVRHPLFSKLLLGVFVFLEQLSKKGMEASKKKFLWKCKTKKMIN